MAASSLPFAASARKRSIICAGVSPRYKSIVSPRAAFGTARSGSIAKTSKATIRVRIPGSAATKAGVNQSIEPAAYSRNGGPLWAARSPRRYEYGERTRRPDRARYDGRDERARDGSLGRGHAARRSQLPDQR